MPKQSAILVAAALVAFVPLSPAGAAAGETQPAFRLAMMEMMPMGGAMPQPAPGGSMPGMGGQMGGGGTMPPPMPGMGGAMPAQGQNQMPMGAGGAAPPAMPGGGAMPGMAGAMPAQGQNQMPMGGCGMMEMMQNMMRMGAAPQSMPPMQPGAMAGGTPPAGSSAARLEGRIAFLRTELRITDAQAPAWESFATALRGGREHLDAARAALQDSGANADPMARLKSFENHLRERADAIHTTQMAFITLHAQLDDAQKKQAATTMLPFIGAF